MLRVAHILPDLAVGGRERIVADLCAGAASKGIAPAVVLFDRSPPGVALVEISGANETIQLYRSEGGRALATSLAAALDRLGVQVAHAHGHVAGYYVGRSGWRSGARLATMHIAPGWSDWKWLAPVAWQLRGLDRVTAVSDDLASRWSLLTGRRIATIPAGIDLAQFPARAPRDFPPGGPLRIAMVSRLHPVKRHCDMFAALRLLKEAQPDIELHVAGEGEAGFAKHLQAIAPGNVRFVGAIADVSGFLADKDAFVLCSDHEGSPLALLEAMASGVPAIATRVGGVRDMAGHAALLVDRRDPAALAQAIARVAGSPDLRQQLAAAGVRQAGAFSAERQARGYSWLYDQLLAEA